MKIQIAHSPDADDAFMFYGLAKGKVDPRGLELEHVLKDIQTLSELAGSEKPPYQLTAISYHSFATPEVYKNYRLMRSGSSLGDNYGPMLVCPTNKLVSLASLEAGEHVIAVPGLLTSAYLTLKMFAPKAKVEAIPFDEISPKVMSGEFAAGLIIHESQVTYQEEGFTCLKDLGKWWFEETSGLALPLGANAIRRDLSHDLQEKLEGMLAESIAYALANREEALDYALSFGRGLERDRARQFVGMYVNDLTVSLGARGTESIEKYFAAAHKRGALNLPADFFTKLFA